MMGQLKLYWKPKQTNKQKLRGENSLFLVQNKATSTYLNLSFISGTENNGGEWNKFHSESLVNFLIITKWQVTH